MLHFDRFIQVFAQADEPVAPSGFWDWLLGLNRISQADARTEFSWQTPLPVWAWALIFIAVGLLAAISYRHMLGKRAGRIALAFVRAVVLVVIVALLAGPMLVLRRENVETDRVLMLLDRSASMTVTDAPGLTPEQPRSREDQLSRALSAHTTLFEKLSEKHRLDWYGFGDDLRPLADPADLDAPAQMLSALRSGMRQAVQQAAGKPISGVVIFSDGRASQPIGPELLALLKQQAIPVFAVPLGSADQPLDLTLNRVEAPDTAFIKDTVPILVTVSQLGRSDSKEPPADAELQLIDVTTGQILSRKPVRAYDQPVFLQTTPEVRTTDTAHWRIQLTTAQRELIKENNVQDLQIRLEDRPIRVLYIDADPRWEYRYLKNMLVREETVKCSIMLLSADRTFAQEGNIPLRRLPRTKDEIKEYDVIIIGDVPADFFSAEQLELFRDHAMQSGAGLLWIAGEHDMPVSYAANALTSMLPMINPAETQRHASPALLEPTRLAASIGVLQLRDPQDPNPNPENWPSALPALWWTQKLPRLKPAAEVLATDQQTSNPLVVRMRFGAGQSLYVATDETWRWRYGRGDLWSEQFWMQNIRLLARSRLAAGEDVRMRLEVSHRRAVVGDSLVVRLSVNDQALLATLPESIPVSAQDAGEGENPVTAPDELITLRATTQPGEYQGIWTPSRAGKRLVRVSDPSYASLAPGQSVVIMHQDDEMRYPATNHPLLADLAAQTNGRVLKPDELPELEAALPNRSRHAAADISEALWNSPLAFILLLLLLTGEWIGRKLIGLA